MSVTPAFATSLSTSGAPDFVAGTVPLAVTTDPTVTRVTFELRPVGKTPHTAEGVEGSAGRFTYPLTLVATTTVVARAYETGALVWSDSAKLTPGEFAPRMPVLALRDHELVRTHTELTGTAQHAATITVSSRRFGGLWVDEWTGRVSVGTDGAFRLPSVGLPYGGAHLRITASNAFGSAMSDAVHAYNVGAVPAHKRLVLIDKSNRRLWVIVDGRLTFTSRCAIGMPWTPTPTGTFRLGKRHRAPSAYWGPWRLNLLHKKTFASGKARYVKTKYYIHGTSVPSSIGRMASHGCVRLRNKDIRRLSTVVDGYMAVIRE